MAAHDQTRSCACGNVAERFDEELCMRSIGTGTFVGDGKGIPT
jgi:hypothetical protein